MAETAPLKRLIKGSMSLTNSQTSCDVIISRQFRPKKIASRDGCFLLKEGLINLSVGKKSHDSQLCLCTSTYVILVLELSLACFWAICNDGSCSYQGLTKGWLRKRVALADVPPARKPARGCIRMFPRNENRNEGAFACSLRTKTGTRGHSPFY